MKRLTDEMVEYIKTFIRGKCGGDDFSLQIDPLFGDGSDRKLYRVKYDDESAVFVNNGGVVNPGGVCENDSFDYICRHLAKAGVLTPLIYSYSKEKGWFILEDLGDETLFIRVKSATGENEVEELYRRSIDELINMQVNGIKGFDANMCYSTRQYDKELILKHESGYFFREFVNGYMKLGHDYDDFAAEFDYLADEAMKNTHKFFMHRDYQARNIMIKDGKLRIIDFQAGRVGPLQYDVAALVIDAFVNLPFDMKDSLFDYYLQKISAIMTIDKPDFLERLYLTAVHRTMQALGAYAFLTLKKGKTHFEEHMGKGVNNLRVFLGRTGVKARCPKLCAIAESMHETMNT